MRAFTSTSLPWDAVKLSREEKENWRRREELGHGLGKESDGASTGGKHAEGTKSG